jgi:hypothetical protein
MPVSCMQYYGYRYQSKIVPARTQSVSVYVIAYEYPDPKKVKENLSTTGNNYVPVYRQQTIST